MFNFYKFTKDKRWPENWASEEILDGKLYRFVDTGINLPLIEINERDLPKLEGYEFFEPTNPGRGHTDRCQDMSHIPFPSDIARRLDRDL